MLFQASAITDAFDADSDTKTSALFPWSIIYHFWSLDADVDVSKLEMVEPSLVAMPSKEILEFLCRFNGATVMNPYVNPVRRRHTTADANIIAAFQINVISAETLGYSGGVAVGVLQVRDQWEKWGLLAKMLWVVAREVEAYTCSVREEQNNFILKIIQKHSLSKKKSKSSKNSKRIETWVRNWNFKKSMKQPSTINRRIFNFLAVFFCDDDDLAGTKPDPQKSRDPIRFDPYGEFRRRNDNLESDVVSNLKWRGSRFHFIILRMHAACLRPLSFSGLTFEVVLNP